MKPAVFDLNKMSGRHFHFIGCAGAGMAPLMRLMSQRGFEVSGSDLEENSAFKQLKKAGLAVFRGHSERNLPEDRKNTVIVYSSAVNEGNPELAAARFDGVPCMKRGALLAAFARLYKHPVSVGGSHGKTTVTAMISHILRETGKNPGFLVGGKVSGWQFSADIGSGDIFVSESDESDGSNTLIISDTAVVTNVDDDHSWSVGGEERLYENYRRFAMSAGRLVSVRSPVTEKLFADCPGSALVNPENVMKKGFFKSADEKMRGFQRLNAALALTVTGFFGAPQEAAEEALLSFPGVERRMSQRFKSENFAVVEDYAHHPSELAASIAVLRESYPGWTLKVIFQPHRYARLEKYLDKFAVELSKADSVILAPLFAAWVEKGPLSCADLARKTGEKSVYIDGKWSEIANEAVKNAKPKTVFAIIGAGDIEKILPHIISLAGSLE